MRPRQRHTHHRPREGSPPPAEPVGSAAAPPMVFDPNPARLIAPWVTCHNEMTPEREQVPAMPSTRSRILADALRVPVWIFADG